VVTLEPVRPLLWDALRPLARAAEHWKTPSTRLQKQPRGAFYYFIPIPPGLGEEAALRVLASEYGLLLLPGSAFGAPGHLRLGYGGIRGVGVAVEVAARLRSGVEQLCRLSDE